MIEWKKRCVVNRAEERLYQFCQETFPPTTGLQQVCYLSRAMHIIGGGVIGLCAAWYLHQAGHRVTVIDKTHLQDGCSFGNAGLVVPSHSVPLAAPGVAAQGIRWMFSAKSPFYIRPRQDPDLLRWSWKFYRSCTKEHVDRATPVLRDFHLLSKSLYRTFAGLPQFDFDYAERGSLMLYRTAHGAQEEIHAADNARALGLQVSTLSYEDITAMEPQLPPDVTGGVFYHDDAQLYPGRFIRQLQKALRDAGVEFMTGNGVEGFEATSDRITHLRLKSGDLLPVENILLAAGAWSAKLAKQLGIRLLIQDGKGYSVTLKDVPVRPSIPAILTEARVAVTPMGNDLRIGGTLEVSNFSSQINKPRVAAILEAMSAYYPGFQKRTLDDVQVWHGFRPVSADGLPYIGRTGQYTNLIVATGHAMLGMSLGPATGLLVSELVERKSPSLPLELFDPERHA